MAAKQVIEGGGRHPISPFFVDTTRHFHDAFGNYETEASAHYIVLLAQQHGGWVPFTQAEIETLYREMSELENFSFNRLVTEGFVVLGEDGKYRVTHEFVTRCFLYSPSSMD